MMTKAPLPAAPAVSEAGHPAAGRSPRRPTPTPTAENEAVQPPRVWLQPWQPSRPQNPARGDVVVETSTATSTAVVAMAVAMAVAAMRAWALHRRALLALLLRQNGTDVPAPPASASASPPDTAPQPRRRTVATARTSAIRSRNALGRRGRSTTCPRSSAGWTSHCRMCRRRTSHRTTTSCPRWCVAPWCWRACGVWRAWDRGTGVWCGR